jgi:hypothetical protein
MKPKWRGIAERAWNRNFDIDEITTAMGPALISDFRDETGPGFFDSLRSICEEQENLLIKDNVRERFEALRQEAGTGIGRRVLDNVIRLSEQDEVTVKTAIVAIERAGTERIAKSGRQMEEHAQRETSAYRSRHMRPRLEEATTKAPVTSVAKQLLNIEKPPSRASGKKKGLEEGPKLK